MKEYKGQITEEYNDAIIGVTLDNHYVYSFDKMIEIEAKSYDQYEDEFEKLDAARQFLEHDFFIWLLYCEEDDRPVLLYESIDDILSIDDYNSNEDLKKAYVKWLCEDTSNYLDGYERAVLGKTQNEDILYSYETMCSITSKDIVDNMKNDTTAIIVVKNIDCLL